MFINKLVLLITLNLIDLLKLLVRYISLKPLHREMAFVFLVFLEVILFHDLYDLKAMLQ